MTRKMQRAPWPFLLQERGVAEWRVGHKIKGCQLEERPSVPARIFFRAFETKIVGDVPAVVIVPAFTERFEIALHISRQIVGAIGCGDAPDKSCPGRGTPWPTEEPNEPAANGSDATPKYAAVKVFARLFH